MDTYDRIRMIAEGPIKKKPDTVLRSDRKKLKLEYEGRADGTKVTIQFGPYDEEGVQTPHNDALVITARIGDYDVIIILVDSGRTANIITLACFKKMDLGMELKTDRTMLYGFHNCRTDPCAKICLPITLGEPWESQNEVVRFIGIDEELSYNVILGRSSLNSS